MNPSPDYPARRRLAVAQAFALYAERTRDAGPDLADLDLRDEDDRVTARGRQYQHRQEWNSQLWAAAEEVRVATGLVESYGRPPGTLYYVTARRGDSAVACAGPYSNHEEALRAVPRVRAVALELYPATFPCAWGTASIPPGEEPVEVNERIRAALTAPPTPAPPAPVKVTRKGQGGRKPRSPRAAQVVAYRH